MGWYLVIAEIWLLFEDVYTFTSGFGYGHVGEGVGMSGVCTGLRVVVVMSVVGVWEQEVLERTSSSGFSVCCPSVDGGDGGDDMVDGVSSCSLSCLC